MNVGEGAGIGTEKDEVMHTDPPPEETQGQVIAGFAPPTSDGGSEPSPAESFMGGSFEMDYEPFDDAFDMPPEPAGELFPNYDRSGRLNNHII